ncbi:MAG: FAD-dependent oxidoreductase, partial [Pseudomonadota bacterium]
MTQAHPPLKGFHFNALFQAKALNQLDRQFLDDLRQHDETLYQRLSDWRDKKIELAPLVLSELLLACTPILEDFITELFDIREALEASRADQPEHQIILSFKKWFVQRRARRRLKRLDDVADFAELDSWLGEALGETSDRELAVAQLGERYLAEKENYPAEIEKLTQWCIRAMVSAEGRTAVKGWAAFQLSDLVDHDRLVPLVRIDKDQLNRLQSPPENHRQRTGFSLTDQRMSARQVQSEIHYCIYCHETDGDWCSKGFPKEKDNRELGLKTDPLGVTLTGCPLDEKISEMHQLKRDGYTIGALAMIMIDNPMCAATGHRICNDCMKACIYQTQSPVNIPEIETRVLSDVLALPWGVEIYDLLIRWHPLRREQYTPKPWNGRKVLIAGQGPAGFTLAHHLLMAGFAVIGIDGLKIEPLSDTLINKPVRDYEDLTEDLAERIQAGFGGVAEYGITSRWDKNFLKLIYLSLMRRPYYQLFDGVRFGGTITVEDAWEMGFDHLSIAVGAGLPQALPIPGSLAPGMRQANDFLMSLQLTGAFKADSPANFQVRLPAVVIGGGLTGIDTATEVQAYYLAQIENVLERYSNLVEQSNESQVRQRFSPADLEILDEWLAHARLLQVEKRKSQPDIQKLVHQWGGVTIVYRRALRESPAYQRNHEEVIKALEEGIWYAEGLEPKVVQKDGHGQSLALVCQKRVHDEHGHWTLSDEEVTLPARGIFTATGALPNIAYEFEHRNTFERDGVRYQAYSDTEGTLLQTPWAKHCKEPEFGPFTSYHKDDKRVSFVGDTHPVFQGSVVKAIASGMRTWPHIAALFETLAAHDEADYDNFSATLEENLRATVVNVERLSPKVLELQIHAPMAAAQFQPGQFFRLQSYETSDSPKIDGIPLLGAGADSDTGTVRLIIVERGINTQRCSRLQAGDRVVLMGPTGVRIKVP